MELPWKWEWMSAGEIADFWNSTMRRTADKALENADSGVVGFGLRWGTYSLEDLAEIVLLDPLRLGRGFGDASTAGNWFDAGVGVISDVGRAAAFLPLGKLVRLGKAGKVAENIPRPKVPEPPSGPRLPGGPHSEPHPAPAPVPEGAVPVTASASRSQAAIGGLLRDIFYFKDPAPERGVCAFVSITQALRHTGRIFMRIEDLARLVGVEACGDFFKLLEAKAPMFTTEVGGWLGKLNIPYRFVKEARFVDDLMAYAANSSENGVYVFFATWQRMGAEGVAERVGHCMYVGRTAAGEVRIFDRSGHAVRSLEELERLVPAYHGLRHALKSTQISPPVFIPNATIIWGSSMAAKGTVGSFVIAVPIKLFSFLASSNNSR